jgi:hypothetical protein
MNYHPTALLYIANERMADLRRTARNERRAHYLDSERQPRLPRHWANR